MSSVQRELDDFFAQILDQDYSIREVTKGALSQARAKLKPEAFVEMNAVACRDFYAGAPYLLWNNHRLLAVDGSTLQLPDHPSTHQEFGIHTTGRGGVAKRCMASTSIVYDVLNLLTLDAVIDRYAVSEQVLLRQHHLRQVAFLQGDLLLLDRGYPSVGLLYELSERQIGFCVRLRGDWWLQAREMLEKGETDKIVTFQLNSKDLHLQQQYASKARTVRCRLVVVELETGEKEVLCTSLTDTTIYTRESLKELYHLRWQVEEAYKLYKCRLRWDNFSGKTARNVKQDFYAKVFMMSICACLSHPIEQKVRQESQAAKSRHPRQINRTSALAFYRKIWVYLWIKPKPKILAILSKFLAKTTDIVRPGRKFERKKLPKKPPSMQYKQL